MSVATDDICFPDHFLWGAATSAYQIEGSPRADGAGASNWHRFAHTPGRTFRGQTGDVACDHYVRHADDIELMANLGLQAYRFSLSWSRILPDGYGSVNAAGLDFYARLIDALLARNIQPCVTLFHWDLPAPLEDRGGWLNHDMASWFSDYARIVFKALGDRVPLWATLNEPWVVLDAGYLHGVHPPGHRDATVLPVVAHNLMCAHGAAVQAYRAEAQQAIGIVVNIEPKEPVTHSALDVAATARVDAYMNRQFLDPIFLACDPEELRDLYGDRWPEFPTDDAQLISEPCDFVGLNYYTRGVVRHDVNAPLVRASSAHQDGALHTDVGWEVHAASFTRALCWLKQRYGNIAIYVTENGAAFPDAPTPHAGIVEDSLRVDYYRHHLRALHSAIQQGVDVRGYFAWSLLDNFEWSHGYSKRFGIVHVDFDTQRRTPKASAHFYRDVIRTNGRALGGT